MIPGIEILSQNTISEAAPGLVFALFMFLCFAAFIGTIYIMASSSLDGSWGSFIIGFILLICVCGISCSVIWAQTNAETYEEYKVLIDDTVSWNEVYDKYEVIDQEGKIYTIKEKTK